MIIIIINLFMRINMVNTATDCEPALISPEFHVAEVFFIW